LKIKIIVYILVAIIILLLIGELAYIGNYFLIMHLWDKKE